MAPSGDATGGFGGFWVPNWDPRRVGSAAVVWAVVVAVLVVAARHNFLLFHSLAELFSVAIAAGMFIVAWNARHHLDNGYLLVIGIAYGSVAVIDTLHTLSYAGMGVFPAHGANLPTQLWLAARYVESGSLLGAGVLLYRSEALDMDSGRTRLLLLAGYAVVTVGLVAAIFRGSFPVAYIDGVGLTPFKIWSELVIAAMLSASMIPLARHRERFGPRVFTYLVTALVLTVAAELAFTTYVSVYALSNAAGHVLKIVSFYLVYLAVVRTGIAAPHELLFRQLQTEHDQLEAREAELEQQNERLGEFASIVSHDLRNPLNVAQGRLQLARETGDDEHLAVVEHSHERMAALIEDLLSLAKAGETITDPAPLELAAAAREAWESTDTMDAKLVVDGDATILADGDRVGQLLGNLFRNAVEHAGPDVIVRVEPTEAGFAVADNGAGIPEADRDAVFEHGYSSNDDGTGFGLSIVHRIVEEHGWTIHVEAANSGGARFVVSGVTFAESA